MSRSHEPRKPKLPRATVPRPQRVHSGRRRPEVREEPERCEHGVRVGERCWECDIDESW